MRLASGEIHLWVTFLNDIQDEALLEEYRALMCAPEQLQEKRFHFPADRKRYLVTRALARIVLGRYLQVHPTRCEFSRNGFGRPHLRNVQAKAIGLAFNITHSGDVVALGVTRKRAIGIDVERVDARRSSSEVAERFFAPEEVAALTTLPESHRVERFFEYWTFKESYIKAVGMGLSIPLNQFSFRYPDDHSVEFSTNEELADNPMHWSFWQLRPAPEYLLAICAERLHGVATKMTVRKIVPNVFQEALDLASERTSESEPQASIIN